MKVIILAGGQGTRLRPYTNNIPKALVKIGNKPIIWHIMKHYSFYGFNEFIICLGYKGDKIKSYFLNYLYKNSDFTLDMNNSDIELHRKPNEKWKVTLVDTGEHTKKGGRIVHIKKYLRSEINLLTYADGLSDINFKKLNDFHKNHKKMVTITGVSYPSRFGEIVEKDGKVINFRENPINSLINGGFMVINRTFLNYLNMDAFLEKGVLEKLAREGELMVYHHKGNWECMDTEKDLQRLNNLWNENKAFWKVW